MTVATVQGSAQPLDTGAASLIEKETDERRTSNVQHRTSNESILPVESLVVERSILKKTEQHAAQAPALRERIYPSKFCSLIFFGL